MAALIRCPQCSTPTERAAVALWVLVVALIFCFPLAIFLLLAARPSSHCPNCGYTWEA
ncbi:MAG TPA: hypothetical protein VF111_13680 [Thermoanaerobaculia bacterium]